MGIYDRNYYRDDEAGSMFSGRSVVIVLIVVNVIFLFLKSLLPSAVISALVVNSTLFNAPWELWRLVTYTIVHGQPTEVLWGMLGLYFFGGAVEAKQGPREFIRIFLLFTLTAALVWLALDVGYRDLGLFLHGSYAPVLGMIVLFCLDDPKATVIFLFVPVPAWLLGAIFVGFDILGVMNEGANWITPAAHLSAAAMAFFYHRMGWNLGRMMPNRLPRINRPKLRIHDPEAEERQLARQVDAILEKISRDGEASLTKQERRILEQASRRYQKRRS